MPVEGRVRLVEALVAAGVTRIEAVAFVSPKAVPAMAGAAEVLAAVPRSAVVRYSALVPNVRGAELALEHEVDELTVTASLSETYSQRNVRMSIDESAEAIAGICAVAGDVPVDAVLSCSFGSPYEGEIAPTEVLALASRPAGQRLCGDHLADTTGMATPRRVAEVIDAVGTDVGLHLHETRGTALVCAYAGLAARHHPVRHLCRAASEAPRSPPAPPATSPPRSWSRCSTTSACRPASTWRPSSTPRTSLVSSSVGRSPAVSPRPVPALASTPGADRAPLRRPATASTTRTR